MPSPPYFNRSRTSSAEDPTFIRFESTQSGGLTVDGPYPKSVTGSRRSISDVKTPDFRRKVANGQIVLNSLSMGKHERTAPDVILSVTIPGTPPYTYSAVGDLMAYVEGLASGSATLRHISGADKTRAGAIALASAYAKAKAAPIMGGEILSDLGKTVGMLKHPFKGVADCVGRMIRARKLRLGKTTRSITKASAGAWLEYRYGLKPFLLDADTIINEAIRKSEFKRRGRLVARASQRIEMATSATFMNQTASTWLNASGHAELKESFAANAGLIYDMVNRNTPDYLLGLFGLRPCDAPATLWEVIPFSFVIDWFANVGTWLQAITPVPGVLIQGNWVTTVFSSSLTCSMTDGQMNIGPRASCFGSSVITDNSVDRSVNQDLTLTPAWTIKPLSMLHEADAVALTVQQIMSNLRVLRH